MQREFSFLMTKLDVKNDNPWERDIFFSPYDGTMASRNLPE